MIYGYHIDPDLPEGYIEVHTLDGKSIVVQTYIPHEKTNFIDLTNTQLVVDVEQDHNAIKERMYQQLGYYD